MCTTQFRIIIESRPAINVVLPPFVTTRALKVGQEHVICKNDLYRNKHTSAAAQGAAVAAPAIRPALNVHVHRRQHSHPLLFLVTDPLLA